MNFSSYQQNFFDMIETGTGSILLNAKAGSGKTTTIVEASNRLPRNSKVLFLAFNKNIVEELQGRLASHVRCVTFNSCGWTAWRNFTGKRMINVSSGKTRQIIRDNFSVQDQDLYLAFVNRMVAIAKSSGLTPKSTTEEWFNWMDHHNVQLGSEEANLDRGIFLAQKTLEESIRISHQECDFDDQIYMPWLRGATFEKYDYIFIDEAQDTNKVQKDLLKRMLNPGGRLIAVGDPAQAIYGFRGSDANSMSLIARDFEAQEMPLSICYRCCKAVIREAQKWIPEIEASETAPEGKVDNLDTYSVSDFKTSDAVLCRKNAPLIEFAYGLIARRMPVNFVGRDIQEGLKNLVLNMKAKSLDDLEVKLENWLAKQTEKLLKKDREDQIEVLQDRLACIQIFINNLPADKQTVNDLVRSMDELFSGDKGITLSSIHKAKGREFDRVFILDFHLMPLKSAKLPWMMEQEKNLIYVSITRAKYHLTYILSDSWKN